MHAAEDLYPSRVGSAARLTPRIDPVVYARDGDEPPIARAHIEHYRENGFMVLHDVFSAQEVARLKAELDRLRADELLRKRAEVIREPDSREIRSIFMAHQFSRVFRELAGDPRLAGLASWLLGDEVYLHQSRLNCKPGLRGREFYWHSDFETWHVEDGMPRMRALSMSLALTRNTESNGPLMLIPGSHRHFVSCAGETPEQHYQQSLRRQEYGVPSDEQLAMLCGSGGVHSATGEAGSLVVFDCNTMHGSNSNITPMSRSNAFFVFNALGNRVRAPYSGQAPRPEYICARRHVEALPVAPWRASQ